MSPPHVMYGLQPGPSDPGYAADADVPFTTLDAPDVVPVQPGVLCEPLLLRETCRQAAVPGHVVRSRAAGHPARPISFRVEHHRSTH